MIIRSALRGIIPSHGGVRLISSNSTPVLDVYGPKRNSTRQKQQYTRKDNPQFAFLKDVLDQSNSQTLKKQTRQQTRKDVEAFHFAKDLERYQSRRWKEGDIYSPHDLSPEEMEKWRRPTKVKEDVFDVLGINPLHEYKVSQNLPFCFCWHGSRHDQNRPLRTEMLTFFGLAWTELFHHVGVYDFNGSDPA